MDRNSSAHNHLRLANNADRFSFNMKKEKMERICMYKCMCTIGFREKTEQVSSRIMMTSKQKSLSNQRIKKIIIEEEMKTNKNK